MATSRNRSTHKKKSAHYSRTLQEQRQATHRKQTQQLLERLRAAGGLNLASTEKGYGNLQPADVTAFDTLKG